MHAVTIATEKAPFAKGAARKASGGFCHPEVFATKATAGHKIPPPNDVRRPPLQRGYFNRN